MLTDCRRFALNRALFPRDEEFNTNRLICGHLNRLKFPPEIETYLRSRRDGHSMARSVARATRCFCRRENNPRNFEKEKIVEIENDFYDRRELIKRLEDVDITLPRAKKDE